jgi:hypothetical protein
MTKPTSYQPNWENPLWRVLPYGTLGVVIFALTSTAHLNGFLSVYLVLLEAKLGILILYFLIRKIRANNRQS